MRRGVRMLVVMMAGLGSLCAMGGVPTTYAEKKVWPGVITRTETFRGAADGAQVTYRRHERWTDFVVRNGEPDDSIVFFDAMWSIELDRREVTSRCTTTYKVRASHPYPWFTFEVNPLDEKSYLLYSSGTGDVETVVGTMTQACADEPTTTITWEVQASWLAAVPFRAPDELLPPGVVQPPADASPFGPVVSGTLDSKNPRIIRGKATSRPDPETSAVVLTWNLSRSGACDSEAEARNLVAAESARLAAGESAGVVKTDAGAATETARAATEPPAHIGSNSVLGPDAVAAALAAAAGGARWVMLRDGTASDGRGIRRFAVRVGAAGQLLPSLETIQREIDTTCVLPGTYEGAPTLLVGAVQWIGDTYRITVRAVDTETSAVRNTFSDTGRGGSAELQVALEAALAAAASGQE